MTNAGIVIDTVTGKHESPKSHGEGHTWRSEVEEQEITQLVSSELFQSFC